MLSLNNASLRRGANVLFADTTCTIHRGNKIGLVGSNGSGKSSLFALILGNLEADTGSIELAAGTRIAHMAQEVASSSQSAIDYVLDGNIEYTKTIAALEQAKAEDIAKLHDELQAIDGYSARARAAKMMAGLGFSDEDLTKPLSDFSGGWRIRLNLAQTLMSPADLLLLDEPTNHLDLDAILWLTDWIKQFPGTLILISHDRELLDACCSHIAHLSSHRIELYTGNYSAFEQIRTERLSLQQHSYAKQQREIAHMQEFVQRFRAKATKARQAQSRLKALERMEVIAQAHVDSPFSFEIIATQKTSAPLLTLRNAILGYVTPLLSEVNLTFLPGDRFGLLGANGAGKSTLIKTLNAELPIIAGERENGSNLKIGYFSQHQLDELEPNRSAVDHLMALDNQQRQSISEQACRDFLGKFNFHGDKVFESIKTFSGGEKARLALSLITFQKPNLLLLDEPTNHLDLDMRQALTNALHAFEGALVLVSHDQHLMNNTVNEFLMIADGRVKPFSGNLEDYKNSVLPRRRSKTEKKRERAEQSARPGRQSRQLKSRLNTLNSRMELLQRKLLEVENKLADPAIYEDYDSTDFQHLLKDQLSIKEELNELEETWLERQLELESLQQ
jgi:ATP-binding cassette subfamily F protein 3